MNNTHLNAQVFSATKQTGGQVGGQIDLVSNSPSPAKFKKGKSDRKKTLIALSLALTLALGFIAVVIGSSTAEAANLPVFTAANALSAKQDASVAGIAAASLAFIAFGALALFLPGKKK